MSKKKLRYLTWAIAAVLALTPFLYGCASDQHTDDQAGQAQNASTASTNAGETKNRAENDTFSYGEITEVNGTEIMVALGVMADAVDADDPGAFDANGPTIKVDVANVALTNSDGATIGSDKLAVGEVLMMTGTGQGESFVPHQAQVLGAPDA